MKLQEITVPAGGQATIDFPAIPATYKSLVVVLVGRGDTAAPSVQVTMRLNADATASYDTQTQTAVATTTAAVEAIAATSARVGSLAAASAPSGAGGEIEIVIPDYTVTAVRRRFQSSGSCGTADATGGQTLETDRGQWRSTVAVNEVTLLAGVGNFAAGTVATLYGVDPQGGGGGGGAAPVLRLDYHPATDLATGAALPAANTWTDFATEQTFTVGSALSLVEVSCGGTILIGGGAIGNASARLVIDAAGTPITRIISGTRTPSGEFNNVLSGASPLSLSGLAVGSHTVKLQIRADNALSVYCQPSVPDYGFNLRVVEDAG
jgi:hypothetical protein